MDFLNGYDSDEGSRDKETIQVAQPQFHAPKVVSSPKTNFSKQQKQTSDQNKKKRKLNINILPKEIQEALLHSDSILDSDDEDDTLKKSDQQNRFSSKKPITPGNGLLSMLPKPKTIDSSADLFIPRSMPKTSSITKASTAATSKSGFSFEASSVETTVIKKKSEINADLQDKSKSSESMPLSANEDEDEDDGNCFNASAAMNALRRPTSAQMFTFESSNSSSSSSKPSVEESNSSNPPANLASKSSAAGVYSANNAPTMQQYDTSLQQYIVYPSASQYGEAVSGAYAYTEESSSAQHGSSGDIENRRRRERNLEQALINGDLSAVQSLGVSEVIPVQGSGKWDSSSYREQKERELEVYKKYNLDKGVHHQPTKSQNRKHQISSLHFQAAKVELALMESKSKSSKSKYETQMKYGW